MFRLEPGELDAVATRLLGAIGLPEDAAETVAASLVAAELRGYPSHGVHLIPKYAGWVDAGGMDPTAEAVVVHDGGATLTLHGHDAPGHPVGRRATSMALDRVPERSVVTVGIRRATHMGRIGWFAEQAAAAGCCFVGFTNMTSGQPVAAAGSAERRFSTNPITVGLPSFDALDHPVVLDMATSQVALGKLTVRQMDGRPMDDAWTVTAGGEPVSTVSDFEADERGALAPLGGQDAGYKGTGLMLVTELLAATASDSPVTPQPDSRYANAAAFTVIDPLAFTSREAHEARLTALEDCLDDIEYPEAVSAGGGTDADRAYLPGRQEYETKRTYEAEGIPLPDGVAAELVALGRDRGVDESVLAGLAGE